jgi:very-short-patch-repair endonuclease
VQRFGYNKKLTSRAQELRSGMTESEKKLWYQCLRLRPERWLRQRPIGNFIPDFYCSSRKLIVEVDGLHHHTPEGLVKDAERTAFLEGLGIKVIRFTNQEVMNNFQGVCQKIQTEIETQSQNS